MIPIAEQALADILPIAMVLIDQEKKMIWWNSAAAKLLKLNNKKQNKLVTIILRDLPAKEKQQIPYKTTLVTNPNVELSISMIPYDKEHFLLLAQDITHLQHLERMRQDFVANVSHELRTPLTVTHGYLETLLEQKEIPEASWRNIFQQMYQQTIRMEKLVTDLLLLSRLEIDTPENKHFRPIEVGKLLKHICDDAQALSGERQHKIHLDVAKSSTLNGLEDELQSAFSNLIFNAVNYTPAGGTIYIRWYASEKSFYLEVRDSGIGIAKEHLPRLTERFYRVDRARSRSSGGTGLGLAIVKHALIRHKAKLKIKSELGVGSTFICMFPRKESAKKF